MNIFQAMERVDRSDWNRSYIDFNELADLFNMSGLYGYYNEDIEFRAYWLTCWKDTDEDVGTRVYDLHGEPVAYSKKTGRKSDEVFYWVSEQAYKEVRTYLLSLSDDRASGSYNLLAGGFDIPDTYRVDYNDMIFGEKYALYNGEEVKIVEFIREGWQSNRVVVSFGDGSTEELIVSELEFFVRVI